MEQRLPYYLKTVALVIWSAVLLYFCFSQKLPFFLAPVFRPMVWVAGFTLAAIALCFAIFARPKLRSHELECEHFHEENPNVQIMAFLVLVLPVSMALFISKEGYSKLAVANRGFMSSVAGSQSQLSMWENAPADAALMVDEDEESRPLVYAPDAQFIQPMDDSEAPSPGEDYALDTVEPPLPGQAPAPPAPESPSEKVAKIRGFLKQMPKDEKGYTMLETTDLVYAAQDPGFREAMRGMKVALLGQYYPGSGDSAKKLADARGPGQAAPTQSGGDFFWVVRMTMNCCAADARPSAVKVDTAETAKFGDMQWISARGVAEFRASDPSAATPTSAEGNPEAAAWEPWLKAESIVSSDTPDEPYLF